MRCSKCGAQLSKGAATCPQCNAPVEQKKMRGWKVAIVIAAVVAAVVIGMAATSSQNASRATSQKSTSSTSTSTAATSQSTTSEHTSTTLQVYAEDSLSKALSEIEALYSEKNQGIAFTDTQYSTPTKLNAALENGAQADVLITASSSKMDTAAESGYIRSDTRVSTLSDDLVIVAADNSASITECSIDTIASGKYKLVLGDSTVASGNAARQALESADCYTPADTATGSSGKYSGSLADAGMVIQMASAATIMKSVQTGSADVGIVYRSDAYLYGGVKIVGTVPANIYTPGTFPAAVATSSPNAQEALRFLTWCSTDADALRIWQKWGFATSANQ